MKKILKSLVCFSLTASLAAAVLPLSSAMTFAEEPDQSLLYENAQEFTPDADDHSTFSEEMLSEAIELYASNEALNNTLPDEGSDPRKIVSEASMPYTGRANTIAFHICFPNDPSPKHQQFPEGDTADALRGAFGYSTDGTFFPSDDYGQYTSLYDYYQRASYGKLSIYGDVFEYTAPKPKSEYPDAETLISEAMAALDAEIDYGNYDADHDGRIDTVYLHIPYDETDEWASTWWPSCSTAQSAEPSYDSVSIGSFIIFSRTINSLNGRRTLTHETGHAMGFPDYYSYDKTKDPAGGDNYLSGILSFDMMDNDLGDHNGFSKWMAGWLDESSITRVVANKDGVVATRNGTPVGTFSEDGSVTLELSAFDSEEISETGGVIVVGNDNNAPFSSYFLIQYDRFAGNQKVYYAEGKPLASGFRVFRVQAELSEAGHLKYNNTSGSLYNKLIELVDPDYKSNHSYAYEYIPSGFGSETYTCMFYGGTSLTPTTGPSTNFKESIATGFTGICIDFLESGETSGKLRISWSDKDKPPEKDFVLTCSDVEAFPGGFNVTLTANQDFYLANPMMITAVAKIGEEFVQTCYLRNVKTTSDSVTGTFYFDTDKLTDKVSLTLNCRAETFSYDNGKLSERIQFPLPLSPEIVELSESGYIRDSEVERTAQVLSPVFRKEDGALSFYSYSDNFLPRADTKIFQYTFSEENPTEYKKEVLENGSEEWIRARDYINTTYMPAKPETAAELPVNSQLGEYPVVLDAVKIGDFYYVASFRQNDYSAEFQNRLAISKLGADGTLIRQITPAGDEIIQNPGISSRVRILPGPNQNIAVLLFRPFQTRSEYGVLENNAATFFLDPDLNSEGRLDNFSTGCGTWLPDGRFIAFGQRMDGDMETNNRTELISYDITKVLDPKEAPPEDDPGKDVPPAEGDSQKTEKNPDTSDANAVWFWILLMTLSPAAAAAVVVYRRKRYGK